MADDVFAQAARNIGVVVRATNQAAEPALTKIGLELVGKVKEKLSEPGAGRTYERRGVTHRASAPGQPPAVDTGKYRASWDFLLEKGSALVALLVGTPDKRARWLEYGTSKMAARPHLRPVVEASRNKIGEVIAAVIAVVQRDAASGL